MPTFTVTTAVDLVDAGDDVLSLREAVARANATAGADAIGFAGALEGSTLTLTQGQLTLNDQTRIDGDAIPGGARVTISGGGESRVLTTNGRIAVELQDLAIADGRETDENGGGIQVGDGGRLTMAGCVVRGCAVGEPLQSYNAGGGIFAGAATEIVITDSELVGNFAAGSGGAVFSAGDSHLDISGSRITRNTADGGDGGGVHAGGALYLSTSSITGNVVGSYNNDAGSGGGVWVDSQGFIDRTLLADNSSPIGGGAGGNGIRFTDCTIADNRAFGGDELRGSGGGIFGSNMTLNSCTVTGNYADSGRYYGGGAGIASGSVRIANSIVAGNFNAEGPSDVGDFDPLTPLLASNGRNVFGSNVAGAVPGDLENVDPAVLFAAIDPESGGGRLALNGGPTRTVALRDAAGNPALGAAEPIDLGGDIDQRGIARPQPGDTNPDLGAFELAQSRISRAPGPGNDVLAGGSTGETIAGLAGADLIRGGGGGDMLFGGGGSDTLRGEAGDDLLKGGFGNDWMHGGAGADTVSYLDDGVASPLGIVLDLRFQGGAVRGNETDRLFDIGNAQGSNNPDSLTGNEAANRLDGAGGADLLFGENGPDALLGGGGNDRLAAGSGDDRLGGGLGGDHLGGGSGADRFAYGKTTDSVAGRGRDVIEDFVVREDRIELAAIDACAATLGENDTFVFLADRGAAFTAPGQVRWLQVGGETLVEASTDRDAAPELQIELAGLWALTAADFVL